jgi:hypothetical protein
MQANVAASLPSAQPPPSYATATTSIAGQQTTRIDLSQLERQQAELEQREKRLRERERELRTAHTGRKFFFSIG